VGISYLTCRGSPLNRQCGQSELKKVITLRILTVYPRAYKCWTLKRYTCLKVKSVWYEPILATGAWLCCYIRQPLCLFYLHPYDTARHYADGYLLFQQWSEQCNNKTDWNPCIRQGSLSEAQFTAEIDIRSISNYCIDKWNCINTHADYKCNEPRCNLRHVTLSPGSYHNFLLVNEAIVTT
jgi:hypothetical protein